MRARRLLVSASLAASALFPAASSAVRAEEGCTPDLDVPALPAAPSACTGARPGAHIETPIGSCTANFVFQGSDGHRYIGTAGHCILKYDTWTRTWRVGEGPWAKIDGRKAGEFAYASYVNGWTDFALVRLDPAFPWSPAMMHFGGPTGLYTEHQDEPTLVHYTGNAVGIGNVFNKTDFGVGDEDVRPLSARTGVASHTMSEEYVYIFDPGWFGDSGSGVITEDGRALGTLVWLTADPYGNTVLTRTDWSLELAEHVLGIELTLQTAPLNPSVP